jgi:photosystem II stability/assembly factor-like uncharacterized protein
MSISSIAHPIYRRLRHAITAAKCFLLLLLAACAFAQWNLVDSGTKSNLRGINNAGHGVIWASGANGVVLRSEDDGYLWQQCAIPPEAAKLDFRGIRGWDADHAIVLSSGPGAASRLYETTDGCAHWKLLLTNPDAAGFWDAIAFRNPQQGVLLGDPVDGRFVIMENDGGGHWSRDERSGLEAHARGEGAFAASNSALALSPDGKNIYFATGGIAGARLFYRLSKSAGWRSVNLPDRNPTESAGIFSLAFHDSEHGVAVGGDYKQANRADDTAAWTSDAGLTWTAASAPPSGYRSTVAWNEKLRAWIAAGPNGSDISYDDGRTWKRFDNASWNALSLPWAAGPDGKIANLDESAFRHNAH